MRAMGTAVDPPQPLAAWPEGVVVTGACDSWSITAGTGSYSVNRSVVADASPGRRHHHLPVPVAKP